MNEVTRSIAHDGISAFYDVIISRCRQPVVSAPSVGPHGTTFHHRCSYEADQTRAGGVRHDRHPDPCNAPIPFVCYGYNNKSLSLLLRDHVCRTSPRQRRFRPLRRDRRADHARGVPLPCASCAAMPTQSDNFRDPGSVSGPERSRRSSGLPPTRKPETTVSEACGCPERSFRR
jgi:hypothetical protein